MRSSGTRFVGVVWAGLAGACHAVETADSLPSISTGSSGGAVIAVGEDQSTRDQPTRRDEVVFYRSSGERTKRPAQKLRSLGAPVLSGVFLRDGKLTADLYGHSGDVEVRIGRNEIEVREHGERRYITLLAHPCFDDPTQSFLPRNAPGAPMSANAWYVPEQRMLVVELRGDGCSWHRNMWTVISVPTR